MATLIIIDGSYWGHAAHGVMPGLARSDGHPIGATLGYTKRLWSFLRRPPTPFTHIVVAFDAGGRTWRHEAMPGYKANRDAFRQKHADGSGNLYRQWPLIRDASKALGVSVLSQVGVEADDIIATLARKAKLAGMSVVVVSSDKDLLQLVDLPTTARSVIFGAPSVQVYDTRPDNFSHRPVGWRGDDAVYAAFGVRPDQIPDYLALVGDVADNIPGVPCIGPVRAAAILAQHGSVEAAIEAADHDTPDGTKSLGSAMIRYSLKQYADQIRLAKHVTTVCPHIQIEETLDGLVWRQPDLPAVLAFTASMEFEALGRQIEREWPQTEEAAA